MSPVTPNGGRPGVSNPTPLSPPVTQPPGLPPPPHIPTNTTTSRAGLPPATGWKAVLNGLIIRLLGIPGTWRWQTALFIWLLAALAALALILASVVTSSTYKSFSQIAAVAVPSINATNQATNLLSSQVADTAEYILSSQSVVTSTTNAASDPGIHRRATLRQSVANAQANYDQQLQNGYAHLLTYRSEVQPSVDAALKSLSFNYAALQESLAQARGLADQGLNDQATATYLLGQDNYYTKALADLYYLRSIHVTHLEEAEKEATGGAAIWQYVAIGAALLFAVALLLVTVWLVLRIKRVLQPLLNVALLVLLGYSGLLAFTFINSRTNLSIMVDSYTTISLLSDAQLDLTDAAADQIKWVIGGKLGAGSLVGDPVYEQDFKTKTARLLGVQQGTNDPVADPSLIVSCRATPPTGGYISSGALAQICSTVGKSTEQSNVQDQFVQKYKVWLNADTSFRQAVSAGDVTRGLNVRAASGYSSLQEQLGTLKQSNIDEYILSK